MEGIGELGIGTALLVCSDLVMPTFRANINLVSEEVFYSSNGSTDATVMHERYIPLAQGWPYHEVE